MATIAHQVAALLHDDGSQFATEAGENIADVCARYGGQMTYSNRANPDRDTFTGEPLGPEYESGPWSGYISGDPIRYAFPDGSAIVVAGGGWDIEGAAPFSWIGA